MQVKAHKGTLTYLRQPHDRLCCNILNKQLPAPNGVTEKLASGADQPGQSPVPQIMAYLPPIPQETQDKIPPDTPPRSPRSRN